MADALAQAMKWHRRVQQMQKLFAQPQTAVLAPTFTKRGPVAYAREVLGIDPWSKQREVLEAVEKYDRVSVRSGHKVSKSNSAAILGLWWMDTGPDAQCVMTSSSSRQVRKILWKEVKNICRRVGVPAGATLSNDPNTGLQFADGRELVGFSTDDEERMAGVSGARLLFIADEASGIEEEILEAMIGNMAGGAKIVLFSNPTRTAGTFFESHHARRGFWHCIHISSRESPNITGERTIPGLATKQWVDLVTEEWGPQSPFVAVRVDGNFPSQAENAVIGIGLVEAARRRWDDEAAKRAGRVILPTDGLLEVGLDVARYGDDEAAIAVKRGMRAKIVKTVRSMDGFELGEATLQVVREFARPNERARVKVDVIGVGASAFDYLNHSGVVDAVAVDVGESATVDETKIEPNEQVAPRYERLRDQLWFGAQAWLKQGGMIAEDAKLETELIAPTYSFSVGQKLKVMSKDEIKKKIRRSPDRADALCLAIYNPPDPGVVEQGRLDLMRR